MFDLHAYLNTQGECINAALDRHMPPEDAPPMVLHKAMRYCVFSGGKRIRPALCLAAAESVGAPATAALMPALAAELLHTYTLIHDDLPCMDDDALRRGKPTCHVVFGEANAVLAGDALQALAFELLARADVPSSYASGRLVLELARAAGSQGVVGGQVEDIAVSGSTPTPEMVEFIHTHKTADLFRAAVRMGAIAGNAREEELRALSRYAHALGRAFQIVDDLLDTDAGDSGETSCLAVQSPDEARALAENLTAQAIAALATLQRGPVEPLEALARFTIERTH